MLLQCARTSVQVRSQQSPHGLGETVFRSGSGQLAENQVEHQATSGVGGKRKCSANRFQTNDFIFNILDLIFLDELKL
jgi:hypothetical protein